MILNIFSYARFSSHIFYVASIHLFYPFFKLDCFLFSLENSSQILDTNTLSEM